MCLTCGKSAASESLLDPDSQTAFQLARCVCITYKAYETLQYQKPSIQPNGFVNYVTALTPTDEIWTNVVAITVTEPTPNQPWWEWKPKGSAGPHEMQSEHQTDHSVQATAVPQPYPSTERANGVSSYKYDVPEQLIGFTATIAKKSGDPGTKNVLVLRGTVTLAEASASIGLPTVGGYTAEASWDDITPIKFPINGNSSNKLAQVKTSYWSSYTANANNSKTVNPHMYGLSDSLKAAVAKTASLAPNRDWYATAHSLGGAYVSLGVLDCMADNVLKTAPVTVMTFGSVAVGNIDWASWYNMKVPNTYRVANLCDFVPSIRAIVGTSMTTYVHVGLPWLFVWQWDSDWQNHSLKNTYMAMFSDASKAGLISKGTPTYPVGIRVVNELLGSSKKQEDQFTSEEQVSGS